MSNMGHKEHYTTPNDPGTKRGGHPHTGNQSTSAPWFDQPEIKVAEGHNPPAADGELFEAIRKSPDTPDTIHVLPPKGS